MKTSFEENYPDSDGIDYTAILSQIGDQPLEAIISSLLEELPHLWYDAYLQMTQRPTNVCRFTHGTFEYIFDDYGSLEAAGKAAYDRASESRLVAVLGRSNPIKRSRDDYRLRGWVGRTEESFGKEWDKGHFIAHSLGGAVDGIEANVFVQRRDLNRGWSARGKLFREMGKYCAQHPGTFCFNRPLYCDNSARPSCLEFGVLKSNKQLWVERFDNR
ncbi:hypothetical protein KJ068_18950 [bacterium]|nr:hypothetical protein [bacterium]